MSSMAAQRLIALYPIDSSRVVVIPHGAATLAGREEQLRMEGSGLLGSDDPPQLLTWGLIGPGKGIEHVLDALALLGDITPAVRYTVAGVTHPKVLAEFGDTYRQGLIQRAEQLGLTGSVTFDDTYRDVPTLTRFIASASVVVLPYDSRDQVTSGVLVDALAVGRPVIATEFPHAVELLSTGAGVLVPHNDPRALAAAIRTVLGDRHRWEMMAEEARRLAPSLSWDAVARAYVREISAMHEDCESVRK